MYADQRSRRTDSAPAPTRAVTARGLFAMAVIAVAVPAFVVAASTPAFVAGAAVGTMPAMVRRARD